MKKSLIYAFVAVSVCAAPVISFAQSNAPITRAQVNAELAALQAVGYDHARGEDTHYPADIQAALARVSAEQPATQAPAMQ